MRLEGKVALVTGAQQGIGRAIALALARDGADVGINYYLDDPGAAEAVAAEARALGRRAVVVPADVARATDVDAMLATVSRTLGVPDVLVNNAGIFPRVAFLDMSEREWDHVLAVNLKGSFLAARRPARAMVAGGRRGAIVSLSSVAIRGVPLGVHYAASKAGLVGLTRAMALALAPHGIRVNAVAPGLTDTAQPRYGNTDAELLSIARATIPLGGRMAEPSEIASVVTFLASEEARFVTGQLVHVNGGSFMG